MLTSFSYTRIICYFEIQAYDTKVHLDVIMLIVINSIVVVLVAMTCLYLLKKFGVSNNLSHVALPVMISSVTLKPCWNSSCITLRVEHDTLKVEFCCGYAGVIIGIKW